MEKKVFMEKLYSNRRQKLIERCIELHRMGRRFLYILPSSAAIRQVRDAFVKANRGLLGSKVIVFDDLEMDITANSIPIERIVFTPMDRVLVSRVCDGIRSSFKYYGKIYSKKGFHEEITAFIRTLKRNCIDEEYLERIMESITDEVLKDKLYDLLLIYRGYDEMLSSNGIYDRNDISLKAVEFAGQYKGFDDIDCIVIDGFTDIEVVSMRLVERIAGLDKIDIYVNCPYENPFMKSFLEDEISNPFEAMGFEIIGEDGQSFEVKRDFKELCSSLFSGQRTGKTPEGLEIIKYPCMESEIRETARSIKQMLMKDEYPGNIALYINRINDYDSMLVRIFEEFRIPVSLDYELPLASSETVREIINRLKKEDNGDKDWTDTLDRNIEDGKALMGDLIKRVLSQEAKPEDILEMKAIDALSSLVSDMKSSLEKGGVYTKEMDRKYFAELLSDGVREARISIRKGNDNGVRVLDTSLAKGVYYSHVYILGLNEGEVPRTVKSTGLFDSFECGELVKNGLRYRDYAWELTREKTRFNLALASASNTMILSCRGADEDGKFAIPSSFIDEVRFVSGIEFSGEITMRDRFHIPYDKVMSSRELEGALIKHYFESKYKGSHLNIERHLAFVEGCGGDVRTVVENGMVEYHREKEKEFNQFEGILGTDFSLAADKLCSFSPSSLREYVKCPFSYMMTYLFGLGEKEEDEAEYSSMEIGNLYHEVLYHYYRDVKQYDSFDERILQGAFDEVWKRMRAINVSEEELDEVRLRLYGILRNFINTDLSRMKAFEKVSGGNVLRPYFLERAMEDWDIFGMRIRCKVDRVDLEYENRGESLIPTGRYVIYDYKKKSIAGMNEVLGGTDFQLGVYYYLVRKELEKSLKNPECIALLYLSLEDTNEKNVAMDGIYLTEYKKALSLNRKRSDINGDKLSALMEYVKTVIVETAAEIKEGRFNYKPMCSIYEEYTFYSCVYAGICRYSNNKVRVLMEEQL